MYILSVLRCQFISTKDCNKRGSVSTPSQSPEIRLVYTTEGMWSNQLCCCDLRLLWMGSHYVDYNTGPPCGLMRP